MKPWMAQSRIENSGKYPPPNELNETNTFEPPDWPVIEKKVGTMQFASFPNDILTFLFSFSIYLLLNIFGYCDANTTELSGRFSFHCKKDQMIGIKAVKMSHFEMI